MPAEEQSDLFVQGVAQQVVRSRAASAVERRSVTSAVSAEPPDAMSTRTGLSIEFVPMQPGVLRHTFSMPAVDHALIQQLRLRVAKAGRPTSKSEVVRAGLAALAALGSDGLAALLGRLEKVKPGRKTGS